MKTLAPAIACAILLVGLGLTFVRRSHRVRNFGWGIAMGGGVWVVMAILQATGASLAILGGSMRPMLTALPYVAAFWALAVTAAVTVVAVGLVRISWKATGPPTLQVTTVLGILIGSSLPWAAAAGHFRRSTIPVTVVIRDSRERPVAGAKISWAIMECTGWRSNRGDVWEERLAGTRGSSDANGRCVVSMHPDRFRTDVRVEKDGFAQATLKFECMHENGISNAGVFFPGYANGRSGNPASWGPLIVYLPATDEFSSKQVVQVRQASWRVGVGQANARTVRLWTTRSGVPVEVRVWPEFVSVSEIGTANVTRTCVEPLHGARLALCPAYPRRFDETATSSEWLSLAPTEGETGIIKFHAGSSPSDTFYVLGPHNEEYGRLFIEYCRPELVDGKSGPDYIVEASIAHNPTGSRALFAPITEYRKPPIE